MPERRREMKPMASEKSAPIAIDRISAGRMFMLSSLNIQTAA